MDKWCRINGLKKPVTFIVVSREADNQNIGKEMISTEILRVDISSTAIRNRVRINQSIKVLVPRRVESCIREEGFCGNR